MTIVQSCEDDRERQHQNAESAAEQLQQRREQTDLRMLAAVKTRKLLACRHICLAELLIQLLKLHIAVFPEETVKQRPREFLFGLRNVTLLM